MFLPQMEYVLVQIVFLSAAISAFHATQHVWLAPRMKLWLSYLFLTTIFY
jgi:hypothetical protein